jgi:hypothetical protein
VAQPAEQPPGQRSGQGADSVLPYLMESLRAKPNEPPGEV